MNSSLPALMAALAADATVSGIVADRIYSFTAPEISTFPNIVALPVSMVDTSSIAGMIPPYAERVSIDCRAQKAVDIDNLAVAVRAVLVNAKFTSNGVIIDGCLPVSDHTSLDEVYTIYRRIIDFRVWIRPAA